MSRIRTNLITNRMANGAPTVSNGLVISGVTTSTNVSVASSVTATTYYGSGANLTSLPAQATIANNADNRVITGGSGVNLNAETNLTYNGTKLTLTGNSASPVVEFINTSGSANEGDVLKLRASGRGAGIDDTDVFLITNNSDTRTFGVSNAGTVNTTGDIKMATGKGINSSGIITATSFSGSGANLTSLRANRNLIINGDCSVCQYRGITGETTGVGVLTTDRWKLDYSGHDEEITQEHRNNPVSAAPSKLGISHSFQVKNGNQTSTGSNDYCRIVYTIESQYMRNSGWDFQNSNSFVTLSFWVKSSVSKNFYGQFFCQDSPFLQRSFETGTLSANTWTKVEVSIPGYSTMNFDHNEGPGFIIYWYLYAPTAYTSGNGPLNTWMGYNSTKFTPTDSDAWWTTDNATFDITGVQLEVGSVATPFELKNYDQNLWECKRYYQRSTDQNRGSNYSLETSTWHSADGVQSFNKHNSVYDFKQNFEREMRVPPTLTIYGSSNQGDIHLESVSVGSKQVDWNNNTTEVQSKGFLLRHIEDQSDGNYTSGSGNAFGILAYTLDAEF